MINTKYIKLYYGKDAQGFVFWLRLFGRGFSIKNTKPLFSERYGYKKSINLGFARLVALNGTSI